MKKLGIVITVGSWVREFYLFEIKIYYKIALTLMFCTSDNFAAPLIMEFIVV